ncbi:MAG: PepSY domain-containing protein [Pseudoxanthomonas sp.]
MAAPRSGPGPSPAAVPADVGQALRVVQVSQAARDVRHFRLAQVDGRPFAPVPAGSHLEVATPAGLRHYSICNGPGDLDALSIAVKLEPDSRGGSRHLHEAVRAGDLLAVGAIRNHFALDPAASRHVLLAGGIGITPLLAMARELAAGGGAMELHYFVRALEFAAFGDEVAALARAGTVRIHSGLSPERTRQTLAEVLSSIEDGAHVYACGPGAFMEAVLELGRHLPDERIHREYFSAPTPAQDESQAAFVVAIAATGAEYVVEAGVSIVETLERHGVFVETSCREGTCGTCRTAVVSGQPLHRDVHLDKAEKASGAVILPCVSRAAAGTRLVLDLPDTGARGAAAAAAPAAPPRPRTPAGMRAWHRWISLASGVFMLFMAVTGTLLTVEGMTSHAPLDRRGAPAPKPPPAPLPAIAPAQLRSLLDTGLQAAEARSGAAITGLRLYTEDGEPRVEVSLEGGQALHLDGLGTAVAAPAAAGRGGGPPNVAPWRAATKSWLEHLHRGAFAGWPGLVVVLLTSIALCVLSVTGLAVYWDMFRRRRDSGRRAPFWR